MSWSYKITFLYIGFVLMMLGFVYAATQQHFDLVTEDYYAQELVYEQRIQQIRNAKALAQPLHILVAKEKGLLFVNFPPQQGIQGTLTFYRPDEANVDQVVEIELNDQNQQVIPIAALKRGLWRLQIAWKAEGKSFFQEEIMIR